MKFLPGPLNSLIDGIYRWMRELIVFAAVVIAAISVVIVFLVRAWPNFEFPEEDTADQEQSADAEPRIWTCPMHPQIEMSHFDGCPICGMDLVQKKESTTTNLREISISENARALLNIQVTPIRRDEALKELNLYGRVDYDETRLSQITTWLPGRLDRMYVDFTGARVKKGDHLVELYSPDLLVAQKEFVAAEKALSEMQGEQFAVLRATQQEVVDAAREKLRLYGMKPEQIQALLQSGQVSDRTTILATMSGIVIKHQAIEGQYVETGSALYTIADMSHLWVRLEAFESDLSWLRFNQDVVFTSEAWPGERFEGKVFFIDPTLDAKRRTVRLLVSVPNPDRKLKPGMDINGRLQVQLNSSGQVLMDQQEDIWISPHHPQYTSNKPGQCEICGVDLVKLSDLGFKGQTAIHDENPVLVPTSAVLKTGERSVVYVKRQDAEQPTYVGREIILGPRVGNNYIVRYGLLPGELVVLKGAFTLDGEAQIQGRPSMMTPWAYPDIAASEITTAMQTQWLMADRIWQKMYAADQRGTRIQEEWFSEYLLALAAVTGKDLSPDTEQAWAEARMLLSNAVIDYEDAVGDAKDKVWDTLVERVEKSRRVFHLQTADTPLDPKSIPAVVKQDLNALLMTYLKLTDAMVKGDEKQTTLLRDSLTEDFMKLSDNAWEGLWGEAWKELEDPAFDSFAAMAEAEGLDNMRLKLGPVTAQLTKLIELFGDQSMGPLYIVNCPMAYDNKGGLWLSAENKVLNPYFGDMMLTCGNVLAPLIRPAASTQPSTNTAQPIDQP